MAELPAIEGFRLLEELGSGALSTVYKAVQEPIGRPVALKVLKRSIATASSLAGQLEREARVLAELGHPNIGLLYAFSKTDVSMYLALEFVDGFSLATLLKRKPTTEPDAVAAIGAAVARGLAHAHERGIVHSNIKPANVLLGRSGDVKIFDFGTAQRARAIDEPVALAPTRLEDVTAFATPAYMSPEQILGEGVDARSDVFSLGVVLYQLVCGARPFERGGETDRQPAAHRIRRDPPIPLHRRAPDVPLALERIVMRAIEKAPADRFQSADRMAEQLEELVAARSDVRAPRLVVQALKQAGLVTGAQAGDTAAPAFRRQSPVRRDIAVLAVLGAVAIVGGGLLQLTAHREGEAAGAAPLELVPAGPGYLRVLATPWAEVWIDGQLVDVTPFARPIPLPSGTHYVTLKHPSAPAVRRTIGIASGEVKTIDVVMGIGAEPARKNETGDDGGVPEPSAQKDAQKDKN